MPAATAATTSTASSLAPATRNFVIQPSLTTTVTATDNARLNDADKRSDLIGQISPGIHVASNGGQVRGFLDYNVMGLVYANNSRSPGFQQTLNSNLQVEAIENRAFIDATGTVSRQNISAFGTQSTDSSLSNDNTTQVTTFNVSPYLRGTLASIANYELRASYATTRSGASTGTNNNTTGGSFRLDSESGLSRVGWSVNLSHQRIAYSEGDPSTDDRGDLSLRYAVTPELQLSGKVGSESNNLLTADKQSHPTSGWGFRWVPSETTSLDAQRERRFFGESYHVSFQHRTPRTVWSYTISRDASSDRTGGSTTGSTVYDLLYAQFASIAPDPLQRQALVNSYMQSYNLDPRALVNGGFLTSTVTLNRRQELSLALIGVRSTLVASAFKTATSRLNSALAVADDTAAGTVDQQGLSLSFSHRLTPISNLTASASRVKSSGSLGEQSDLKTFSVAWSTSISPRSDVSLTGRRASQTGIGLPYTENALIASLATRF